MKIWIHLYWTFASLAHALTGGKSSLSTGGCGIGREAVIGSVSLLVSDISPGEVLVGVW